MATVEQIEETTENVEQALAPRIAPTLSAEKMKGVRKAAVLCLALGDEAASEIFKSLEEDEIQYITKELAAIQTISSDMADAVTEEFHNLLLARSYVTTGGVDYAKRLLIKTFGPEAAKRLMDKVMRTLESTAGFDALQKIDPQQLAKIFQSEHPQTIAVVLAHLDATAAANTLRYINEAQRPDILVRMANLQSISQDVVRRISMVLEQKLSSVGNLRRTAVGGVRPVAEICNRLDREVTKNVLEQIGSSNAELSLEIRNLMLTFDDLMLIDDIGIREILQRVDKKVLTMALKGAIPELQERFYSNMSQRAVEMLKEEMDYLGQVRVKDVTAAQREIIDILRQLDEQGVVDLSSGGEDAYVS